MSLGAPEQSQEPGEPARDTRVALGKFSCSLPGGVQPSRGGDSRPPTELSWAVNVGWGRPLVVPNPCRLVLVDLSKPSTSWWRTACYKSKPSLDRTRCGDESTGGSTGGIRMIVSFCIFGFTLHLSLMSRCTKNPESPKMGSCGD